LAFPSAADRWFLIFTASGLQIPTNIANIASFIDSLNTYTVHPFFVLQQKKLFFLVVFPIFVRQTGKII